MTLDGADGPAVASLAPGTRVGAWVAGKRIGGGAWSAVYAGSDGARSVALKVLPMGLATPARIAGLRAMAESEVRLGTADVPGLLPTLEVVELERPASEGGNALVLVLPRARTSLQALLDGWREHAPLPDADRILRELWAALDAVHAHGWVHGDVKPSNVLLMDDGAVRLADFGLAAELDGTHAYLPHAGTVDFVAPEWWDERVSQRGSVVRPGRDRWALGVVAHLVLSGGHFPFAGQDQRSRSLRAQAYARGNEPLRLDDTVREPWRSAVAGLLAVDEAERL
ncbi:MAG TPA: protein kinase, partial [Solirubrobacteraceae bacterium]|nr:protein kinase [Solirubrobacteraceae bacterium]